MTSDSQIGSIAKQSRRTILIVQVLEAVLLAAAMVSIVVMAALLADARHHIDVQQGTILAQQAQIKTAQEKIAALAAANAAEGRRVKQALCDNQFTIATVPVTSIASKVLVQFVESSRKAFIVLGCPGRLGPPPKSLIAQGAKVGVAIRY